MEGCRDVHNCAPAGEVTGFWHQIKLFQGEEELLEYRGQGELLDLADATIAVGREGVVEEGRLSESFVGFGVEERWSDELAKFAGRYFGANCICNYRLGAAISDGDISSVSLQHLSTYQLEFP